MSSLIVEPKEESESDALSSTSISQSKQNSTAVKAKTIYVANLAILCTAIVRTLPFPFLPWMVQEFKINGKFVTAEESGYYVGLIGTLQFAGLAVGSYLWGHLSDKFGRRPTLLVSVFGVTALSAVFGFTNTTLGLPFAICCRFLIGTFNGGVVIVRSIVGDISTDSDQAKGMTLINCAFQLGLIVGPAIGGTLAQPVRQYPSAFPKGGFFDEFPFFLPCIVTAGLGTAIGLVLVVTLPETRQQRAWRSTAAGYETVATKTQELETDNNVKLSRIVYNKKEDQVDIVDSVVDELNCFDNEQCISSEANLSERRDRNNLLDVTLIAETAGKENSSSTDPLALGTRIQRFRRRMGASIRESSAVELLKSGDVRKSVLLYCIYAFPVVGFVEMRSVWLATVPHQGGLGFSELKIGILTASSALFLIPLSLLVIPRIERKLGALQAFYLGSIILVFIVSLFPVLASAKSDILLWPVLVLLMITFRVFIASCFVMCALFINNCVHPSKVGKVNGLSVAFSGITRALAPITTGSLYAWSIGYGTDDVGFPLDHHLAFYFLALAFFLALCVGVRIPERISRKKTN